MTDLSTAKRARMARRVSLKLYAAGPSGAPVLKEDALGPRDDPAADGADWVALETHIRTGRAGSAPL